MFSASAKQGIIHTIVCLSMTILTMKRMICLQDGRIWTNLGRDRLATRWLLVSRDATMLYKVVHSKVGIPLPDFIVRGDSRTRGANPHKFRTIRSSCVLYQISFYPQPVTFWNLLPAPTVMATTIKAFPGSGPRCFIPDVDCSANMDFRP